MTVERPPLTLDIANQYDELGFCIVPLKPRQKEPLDKFDLDKYFKTKSTKEELKEWFENTDNNLGLIMGTISRAFALDIDGTGGADKLKEVLPKLSERTQSDIAHTRRHRTGSGSFQLIFRFDPAEFPEGLPKKKLWVGTERHNEVALIAEGSYIVGPESTHPNGQKYEIIHDTIPILLTKNQINEIISAFNVKQDRPKNQQQSTEPLAATNSLTPEKMQNLLEIIEPLYREGKRDYIVFPLSGYLRKAGYDQNAVERFIALLCEKTGDEEKQSRLTTVKNTFEKSLDEITGYNGLLELFGSWLGPIEATEIMRKITLIVGAGNTARDVISLLREYKQEVDRANETRTHGPIIKYEPSTMGKILLDCEHFATLEDTKDIYRYDSKKGYYRLDGENYITRTLKTAIPTLSSHEVSETIYHIRALTMVSKSDFDADLNIINFPNGLYHIDTMEITPHTPDYLSCSQLPYEYNKNASAELFSEFLKDVLYSEDVDAMLDQIAYTFVRVHIIDIINFLIGAGANGKTVLLGVIERLHGSQLVSHVSLAYLMESRFARALLVDKNVNITTETASISGNDFGVLKELTSPGPQQVERKRHDPHDRILHAKLWTANNKMPHFYDETDGWIRRVNIFEFPHTFEGKKENRKLLSQLTTPEGLAGIFNLLAPRIKHILETREITLAEASIANRREKLELTTDPTKMYAEEELIESRDKTIGDGEMYDDFKQWCKKKKIYIMNKTAFEESLKRNGYQLSRIREGKTRHFVWKNVAFLRMTQTTIAD